LLFRDVGDFDTPAEPFSDFSSGLRFELSLGVWAGCAGRPCMLLGCGPALYCAALVGPSCALLALPHAALSCSRLPP
jgi:hypothetical protein